MKTLFIILLVLFVTETLIFSLLTFTRWLRPLFILRARAFIIDYCITSVVTITGSVFCAASNPWVVSPTLVMGAASILLVFHATNVASKIEIVFDEDDDIDDSEQETE